MTNKKIIALAMAALLAVSMTAGCGKTGGENADSGKVSITVGNWPNPEANPTSYEIIEKTKKTFMEKYSYFRREFYRICVSRLAFGVVRRWLGKKECGYQSWCAWNYAFPGCSK